MRRTVGLALVACLSLFVFPSRSSAQQTLGGITGTITDPSGAAVPNATVRAVNTATNVEVAAQTKSNGSFVIAELPAASASLLERVRAVFETASGVDPGNRPCS
jgi:Carboxypeptidase regulatory-like domain